MVRRLACAVAPLLPAAPRRWVYTTVLGYDLHETAYIGRAFVSAETLKMGRGAWIGDLNVIRGCEAVVLEDDAAIGNLNLINATRSDSPFFRNRDRCRALIMRRGARITSLHFIDCTDECELGELCTIGGAFSQILTHGVKLETGSQHCAPIRFGRCSFVATNCVVLSGVTVADHAVVGAKSLVDRDLELSYTLYVGCPAREKARLDSELGYFTRTEGSMV